MLLDRIYPDRLRVVDAIGPTFAVLMSDQAFPHQPLVSVVVPAYQHGPYIAACLEGILNQDTLFPVEILVGEDESSDGTREICQQCAISYTTARHYLRVFWPRTEAWRVRIWAGLRGRRTMPPPGT